MSQEHLPIFVYGTLKRGEVRERMWPRQATMIELATTRGRLFDLGPYPALCDGDDLIAGELWHVNAEHLAVTLDALDEIECYGKDDVDLYVRRIVECRTSDGHVRRAYTYFFADPSLLKDRQRMMPNAAGVCLWQRHSASS